MSEASALTGQAYVPVPYSIMRRLQRMADLEQRLIKLALFEQNSFTVVRIENYYDSRLKKDAEGNLRTTKRDDQHRHGFGVKSIQHIAQQYGGEVTIRTDDHWFVLTVLLPRQTGLMAM